MSNRIFKFMALVGLCLVGPRFAFAANQDRQSDAVWAQYKISGVVFSTAAIAVDLSNTSSWPHKTVQAVNILAWKIEVDKVAAGTATVKVGVLTSVNASSGTVSWFLVKEFLRNVSNTTNLEEMNLFPAQINTYVDSSGTTPDLATTETVTLSDAEALEYQNDVPLPVLTGAHASPAKGDIIFRVLGGGSTNLTNATLSLLYFTTP